MQLESIRYYTEINRDTRNFNINLFPCQIKHPLCGGRQTTGIYIHIHTRLHPHSSISSASTLKPLQLLCSLALLELQKHKLGYMHSAPTSSSSVPSKHSKRQDRSCSRDRRTSVKTPPRDAKNSSRHVATSRIDSASYYSNHPSELFSLRSLSSPRVAAAAVVCTSALYTLYIVLAYKDAVCERTDFRNEGKEEAFYGAYFTMVNRDNEDRWGIGLFCVIV